MVEPRAGLSAADRHAIAELEQRVTAADGGRLKLEWGVLNTRTGERVDDFVYWHEDELVGFLGMYSFDGRAVELAGMVDPLVRRAGIGRALLDAAMPLIHERGYQQALLVCPRTTGSGAAFATARGAELEHSEHAMLLVGEPTPGPTNPDLTLRPARAEDGVDVARLLQAGFGYDPGDPAKLFEDDRGTHIVVEQNATAIGYVRTNLNDQRGGVYGFVIDPYLQGRGIGRDVLRRVCVELRQQGATKVGLEVAVTNEHALGLYTSLGFEQVITEDYYRLPLS